MKLPSFLNKSLLYFQHFKRKNTKAAAIHLWNELTWHTAWMYYTSHIILISTAVSAVNIPQQTRLLAKKYNFLNLIMHRTSRHFKFLNPDLFFSNWVYPEVLLSP